MQARDSSQSWDLGRQAHSTPLQELLSAHPSLDLPAHTRLQTSRCQLLLNTCHKSGACLGALLRGDTLHAGEDRGTPGHPIQHVRKLETPMRALTRPPALTCRAQNTRHQMQATQGTTETLFRLATAWHGVKPASRSIDRRTPLQCCVVIQAQYRSRAGCL